MCNMFLDSATKKSRPQHTGQKRRPLGLYNFWTAIIATADVWEMPQKKCLLQGHGTQRVKAPIVICWLRRLCFPDSSPSHRSLVEVISAAQGGSKSRSVTLVIVWYLFWGQRGVSSYDESQDCSESKGGIELQWVGFMKSVSIHSISNNTGVLKVLWNKQQDLFFGGGGG